MTEKIFKGTWVITDMEMWDVEPGWYIEFDGKGIGSFHFLCIDAEIDCRIDKKQSPNRAEFSFYGNDEGDEVFGRGWAEVDGKNLVGQLIFHRGDESEFKAKQNSGI